MNFMLHLLVMLLKFYFVLWFHHWYLIPHRWQRLYISITNFKDECEKCVAYVTGKI